MKDDHSGKVMILITELAVVHLVEGMLHMLETLGSVPRTKNNKNNPE
jgi:hypothetical protein